MKLIPLDQLPDPARLTPRELQIYELTGYGMSRGDLAAELGMSVNTLKNHRDAIRIKLGLERASDVTHAAVCTMIHAAGGQGPGVKKAEG